MMDEAISQPLPSPSALTQQFWDACRKHQLLLQRCTSCGLFRFYPTAACPHCASSGCLWELVSGRGEVYSWTVVRKTFDPYWQQLTPYVCAIIELTEQRGLFMPGLLTGIEPGKIAGGMPVEVYFEDAASTVSLPRWRLSATGR